MRALLIAALLLGTTAAAADGLDAGVSPADCALAPRADADVDGLDDACEATLVMAFEPVLLFGEREQDTAREPRWSARPIGGGAIELFYGLAYLVDAGDPELAGAFGHDGDSEFVVLRVRSTGGTRWQLEEGFLSAHHQTACDAGGWFDGSAFLTEGEPRGRPLVYAAEGKHANYTGVGNCDRGGCFQDHCGDVFREPAGVAPGGNLGHEDHRLIDRVERDGREEFFWSAVPFCGWQRDAGDAREGCVPAANDYGRQLADFGFAVPTLGAGTLCTPCATDEGCGEGGVCLTFDGEAKFCGRACDGAHPCPAGHACEALGDGREQCAPVSRDCGVACVPRCDGANCGDDGCGGVCGCPIGAACDDQARCIGARSVCESCPNGSECAPGLACLSTGPSRSFCALPCEVGCDPGFLCQATAFGDRCVPTTMIGCNEGHVWSMDGCGFPLEPLQACEPDERCVDGACRCAPACDGKVCGPDGCGESCGLCAPGEACEAGACLAADELEGGGAGAPGGCGCSAGAELSYAALGLAGLAAGSWRRRQAR